MNVRMTNLADLIDETFIDVNERIDWAVKQLNTIKNRISFFSKEEINQRLYEYAADIDFNTYVFGHSYMLFPDVAQKEKKAPEEYLVKVFYRSTVKRKWRESLLDDKYKSEILYIVYDGKKNQLRIKDNEKNILASVVCDKLTKKIFKCLKNGYADLNMTEKAYSDEELFQITDKITEEFLKGNPSNESIFEYFKNAKKFLEMGSKISNETLAKVFHHISVDNKETMKKCEDILKCYDRLYRIWYNGLEYSHEATNAVVVYEMNLDKENANKAFFNTYMSQDDFLSDKSLCIGESPKYYFKLSISPIKKQEEDSIICKEALSKLAKVRNLMDVNFVSTI